MRRVLKKIYGWLPFKKQVFSVLRKLPIPEFVFKHLYFEDLISVKVEDRVFQMFHYGYQLENEIFWKGINGGWEKTSIQIWLALARRSKTIVDIGANTGIFSLIAKSVNPTASVFAFEPVKRVFEKLLKNIEVNNFNVTPIAKGLSSFDGVATIYDLPTEHIYSVTINKNTNPSGVEVIPTQVEVTTLDIFCDHLGLEQIDLLKIDVETHEHAVLQGAIRMLKRNQPPMIIEILNEEVAKRVYDITKDFNYLYFALNENKGASFCQRPGSMGHYGNYLICQERDAHFLKLEI